MSIDIDAIKARADAATPGPWRWRGNTDHDDPRLEGGPRFRTVMAMVRRERQADDPEAKSFESYLRECEIWDTDPDGKATCRPYTDEEIAEKVQTEWLEDPWEGPNYDQRMAFYDPEFHTAVYARDLSVYEVCLSATSRDDGRVYRADIVGLRHPDAEFIEHARVDVDALLAEIERLRAELATARDRLDDDAWERITAQRDGLHVEAGRLSKALQQSQAELARAKPVLDAALAWRRWFPSADSMFVPENALIAAVDGWKNPTPDEPGEVVCPRCGGRDGTHTVRNCGAGHTKAVAE